MSNAVSIADLPIVDDLDVPVLQEDYVDQAGPAPVKPGNYRFSTVKFAVRTDQQGNIVLVDDKYPTVTLQQVKVVEPVENERQFGAFKDIRFKPFTRKDGRGADVVASDLYDILRAFDETQDIEGYEHAKQLLEQHLTQGTPFLAQGRWTGYDKDYVDAEFAKIGADSREARRAVAKDISSQIYNKARKATKDFTVGGVLVNSIPSQLPDGSPVEAKFEIARFYPSGTELGKGKDDRGRDRIELGPFAVKGSKK